MGYRTGNALYAFEKFGNTVLRTAYNHTENMSEAEDITQEVFLKLHTSPQCFNDDEHMKAWLIRSAINACKNFHKSGRKRFSQPIDDTDESELSNEYNYEKSEVTELMELLPEKYRNVMFLYYYEEYSTKEISEITGQKESTIRSLLKRGREKLKNEMEGCGHE